MSEKIPFPLNELPDILKPYVNKKGILEIITRRKNGTMKPFINIINSSPEVKQITKDALQKSQLENLLSADSNVAKLISGFKSSARQINRDIKKLSALSGKQYELIQTMSTNLDSVHKMLSTTGKAVWLGNAVSLVNLGVSVSGFVIVSKKLDNISNQLKELSDKVDKLDKFNSEFHLAGKYAEIMYDAKDFLRRVSTSEPINKTQVEKLLKSFSTYLEQIMKISTLNIEEKCMFLYTLMPLFVQILIWYLENNYSSFANEHFIAFESCQGLLVKMSESSFVNELTDFYFLEKDASNAEVSDILNKQFLVNCNLMLQLNDTIELLKIAGSPANYQMLKESLNRIALQQIEELLQSFADETETAEAMVVIRHQLVERFGELSAISSMEKQANQPLVQVTAN